MDFLMSGLPERKKVTTDFGDRRLWSRRSHALKSHGSMRKMNSRTLAWGRTPQKSENGAGATDGHSRLSSPAIDARRADKMSAPQ
jgi:hypothetical protein